MHKISIFSFFTKLAYVYHIIVNFIAMKIGQHLLSTAIHVAPQEAVFQVLQLMEELGFDALPVVDNQFYQGLISRNDLEQVEDEQASIQASGTKLMRLYAHPDQHLMDALPIFVANNLSVLPVIREDYQFIGLVDQSNLLKGLNELLGSDRNGSIIVLEMGLRDQAFSHLAHIIESTNSMILSSFTRVLKEENKLEITIKINTPSFTEVTAALLRYDYHIKSTFGLDTDQNDIQARFEHLMNYINM
jgi:acetoin utilization protein AcuB